MKLVKLALLALAIQSLSASAQEATTETPAQPEDLTVITSDRLTFDYQKHFALFETNVVVVDPQIKILSDKMTVLFDEKSKAQSIKAEGNVYIVQDDKKAKAANANYEVDTGKIVLTGSPQVTRGKDILTGDTITFWRDQNKMICEPRARLVIYPSEGGARDLLGDESRGK